MAIGFIPTEEERRQMFPPDASSSSRPHVESLFRELITLVRFLPVWNLHDAAEILMDEDASRRARDLIRDNHSLFRSISQHHENGYTHTVPRWLPPRTTEPLLPRHQSLQRALDDHMQNIDLNNNNTWLRIHQLQHHNRPQQQQQQQQNVTLEQQRQEQERREQQQREAEEEERRRRQMLPDLLPERERLDLPRPPRVRIGPGQPGAKTLSIKVELCNFCWENGRTVRVVGISNIETADDNGAADDEVAAAAAPPPGFIPDVVPVVVQSPVNNNAEVVAPPTPPVQVVVENGSPVKQRLLSLFGPMNIETSFLTAAFVIVGWKVFIRQ